MQMKPVIAGLFISIFAVSAAVAKTDNKAAAYPGEAAKAQAIAGDEAKTKEMKDILFKLVRQDEYLDEAIETLDSKTALLTAEDISAVGLSLKLIKNNLEHIAALNKKQFTEAKPYSGVAVYTRTIFSYSRKVSAKAAQVGELVSSALAKGKKSAMRDAVSSKQGKKKAGGKTLTDLLEEREALETLSDEVKSLKASAKKLNATSKWLYIVSK